MQKAVPFFPAELLFCLCAIVFVVIIRAYSIHVSLCVMLLLHLNLILCYSFLAQEQNRQLYIIMFS